MSDEAQPLRLNFKSREQVMSEFARRMEIGRYASHGQQRTSEWAPYRAAVREDESINGSRIGGISVIGAFLLFSGITVAVARGSAGFAESHQLSPGALLGIAWLIQGAAALLCFVLAVRWLRS
jgi:hypothetical protein